MTNLQLGQNLQNGQYTILRKLGEGGCGITYKARENYSGRIVVIKTLNQGYCNVKKFQQDFRDEAKKLSQFQHPNIVKYINLFQESLLWFIVMEYVEGEDLAELLKSRGRLPEAEALSYIKQIGNALKACHKRGVLHRDVKPQNIIKRSNKSEVVLIDFGIAREFVFNVSQSHTQHLSPGFAPLEQYFRRRKRGDYSDVYALAATLYNFLTNKVPTPAIDRQAPHGLKIFQPDLLEPPIKINQNISETVNQAILKGMAFDYEKRPQTVQDWLALFDPNTSTSSRLQINFSGVKAGISQVNSIYATFRPNINSAIRHSNYPQRFIAGSVVFLAVVGLYIYAPAFSFRRYSASDRPSQEPQYSPPSQSPQTPTSSPSQVPQQPQHSPPPQNPQSPPPPISSPSPTPQQTSYSPPPQNLPSPKPPVYSANIDYTRLENLLASKNFKEADEETLLIMLEITNRQKRRWLDVENIQNFPCADLDKLDLLWYDYSDGRFGFTVQKQQWFGSGGQAGIYDVKVADNFGDRVGWRVNKKWYKQINDRLSAPKGHFPVKANSYAWELNAPYFAERLDACNIP